MIPSNQLPCKALRPVWTSSSRWSSRTSASSWPPSGPARADNPYWNTSTRIPRTPCRLCETARCRGGRWWRRTVPCPSGSCPRGIRCASWSWRLWTSWPGRNRWGKAYCSGGRCPWGSCPVLYLGGWTTCSGRTRCGRSSGRPASGQF